jgi:hypothetical protein
MQIPSMLPLLSSPFGTFFPCILWAICPMTQSGRAAFFGAQTSRLQCLPPVQAQTRSRRVDLFPLQR